MGQKRKKLASEEQPDSKKVKLVLVAAAKPAVEGDMDKEEEMDVEQSEMRKMVRSQNRKKKSGGFQSMGLSHAIFKGIIKKGYKVPTPIQRKTIPIILDGKDVVAMARTGSGKTAAFLIPMFERLKMHSSAGVRALILSPTRELALQTLKFSKELGKFTDIRAAAILGGDKMDDQFAALHENPDLIIATPGRLMHVLVEMNLKLQTVEYVVFDEADRLFEMGFQEQLHSIIARLPESRQTLLFSATLPKLLVEFAKAGLHDPTLLRLDVDSKLSDQLALVFLQCRPDDKTAALLYLLQTVIKQGEQTVVFVATKHHVEYLNLILAEAGITCSYSYSALDQMARKLSVAKFRNKVTNVMIVTDLAARGIDIPMLDNVINYNFPAKSKLFVHRVGRVARAGRCGTAYSLIAPEEMSYVIDLHLFLGRPLKYAEPNKRNADEDAIYGRIPQAVIDRQEEKVRVWMQKTDIQSMLRVVSNGYKHYLKTRPAPSSESIKRVKQMESMVVGYHPLFETNSDGVQIEQMKLLEAMKSYRPNTTIFEINATNKTQASSVMKQKRIFHGGVISRKHSHDQPSVATGAADEKRQKLATVTTTELEDTFSTIFAPKHRETDLDFVRKRKKRLEKKSTVDEKNFLPYRPKDFQTEQGLGLGTSFDNDARSAVLDLTGDDEKELRRGRGRMVWDRKRKRFVRETGQEGGSGKTKTESGNKIESGYKKNIYEDWLKKNKVSNTKEDSDDENNDDQDARRRPGKWGKQRGGKFGDRRGQSGDEEGMARGKQGRRGQNSSDGRGRGSQGGKKFRHEMRDKSQIVKDRTKRADKQAYQAHRTEQKQGRGSGGRGRGSGGRGRGSGGRGRSSGGRGRGRKH